MRVNLPQIIGDVRTQQAYGAGTQQAMNIPIDWAKGTLRLTTGRMTTKAEIDSAVQIICAAVEKLKA